MPPQVRSGSSTSSHEGRHASKPRLQKLGLRIKTKSQAWPTRSGRQGWCSALGPRSHHAPSAVCILATLAFPKFLECPLPPRALVMLLSLTGVLCLCHPLLCSLSSCSELKGHTPETPSRPPQVGTVPLLPVPMVPRICSPSTSSLLIIIN